MKSGTLTFEFNDKTQQASLKDPERILSAKALGQLENRLKEQYTQFLYRKSGSIENLSTIDDLPAGTQIDFECLTGQRNSNITIRIRTAGMVASQGLVPLGRVASHETIPETPKQVVIAGMPSESKKQPSFLSAELRKRVAELPPIEKYGLEYAIEQYHPTPHLLAVCYLIVQWQVASAEKTSAAAYYENALAGLAKLVEQKEPVLEKLPELKMPECIWTKFMKFLTGQ